MSTIRQLAQEQRRLVAVIAQEIRRAHGPNIPDEIANPLTAMIAITYATLKALDEADWTYLDGNSTHPDSRLVPDPAPPTRNT